MNGSRMTMSAVISIGLVALLVAPSAAWATGEDSDPLAGLMAGSRLSLAEVHDAPEATDEEAGERTGYRNVELTGGEDAHRMDDKRGYRNLVIAGPQFIVIFPAGVFGRYHRLLSDTVSAQVGLGYAAISFDDVKFTGFRLLGGMDYHPVGNGMHGFYVGPRVNYRRFALNVDGGTGTGSLSTLNVVGVAGYRAIWHPGFSLGIGLGGGYGMVLAEAAARDADGNEESSSTTFDGARFVLEFTLGWAF